MSVSETAGADRALSTARVALALAVLLGLQPITTDLYLPALPLLKQDLGASMSAVQLTMSVTLLAFGLAQLLMGPLADRFGRRPVLLGGLGLYTLASLGATLAPATSLLVVMRGLQGVGLAASVVCARAMVRDLYQPAQGAHVMSQGLSGLGVIAMLGPVLGGLLASHLGWRSAMGAVTLAGAATGLFVWRGLPETAPRLDPQALSGGPLWRTVRQIAGHAGFRAWTALIACTYGGLFVLLAGSSFVYIGALGLPAWGYGLGIGCASLSYLAGTVVCRRLLLRCGVTGAVQRGALFTLAGGLGMLALGWGHGLEALVALGLPAPARVAPVLLMHCLYTFGHGIHQPCGQASAVGAFPKAAGVASALSGCALALTAFAVGLWLGQVLDGRLASLSVVLAVWAVLTATVAWTLVQRNGLQGLAPARG